MILFRYFIILLFLAYSNAAAQLLSATVNAPADNNSAATGAPAALGISDLAASDISDEALEFLTPEQFLNNVLRRELALKKSENSEDLLTKKFLQAAVFYYDKKWDSAFAAYFPLLENANDFLYGPIAIRLAKCELERGNFIGTRKILLNVRSIKTNKNSWQNVDKILVEATLRDTAISAQAKIDSINARIKSKPNAAYLNYLKWNLAKLTKKQVDYLSVLSSGNAGGYADSAFFALQKLTPNSENYDFVKSLCRKGQPEQCAERVSAILNKEGKNSSKLDPAKKISLLVMLAEAYKQQGKTDLAISQYKKLLDSVEYNSAWMQNLLRLLRNSGQKKEAKRIDSIFQKKFPFSAENANNIWVRALEYEQSGEFEKAIASYKQLSNPKFGKNQRRAWAKFRIGFIKVKEKKYEDAIPIFAEAAAENLGLMPRSASLYFYAESQKLLGNNDKAKEGFFDVISDFPLGYYSWRARQKLEEYGFADKNDLPPLTVSVSDDSVFAWLRGLQKKSDASKTSKDTIVSMDRLMQTSIMLHSGFEEEAFQLYEDALKYHKSRPEFYYLYGKMFWESGEFAFAYRMARNFLDIVPRQKMLAVPLDVMKFLYPIPHETRIRAHAGEKVDPFFVYSIMRQESSFDTKIQSPAGARGLLQIMPATGSFLAVRENIKEFNKDLLFNPYMNIRLGVRYIKDLFSTHGNDEYIGVLGEYNAGPAPAKRWLANYGKENWDIRVEEVSYWETRDYVKRVMGNYWTYREVYL